MILQAIHAVLITTEARYGFCESILASHISSLRGLWAHAQVAKSDVAVARMRFFIRGLSDKYTDNIYNTRFVNSNSRRILGET